MLSSEPHLDADVFECIRCQCDLLSHAIGNIMLQAFVVNFMGLHRRKNRNKNAYNVSRCGSAGGLMVDERWSWPGMCGARFAESRRICLVFPLFVMHGVLVECIGPACFCLRCCFGFFLYQKGASGVCMRISWLEQYISDSDVKILLL